MASEPRTHLVIDAMTSAASLADVVSAALQLHAQGDASVSLVGDVEKLEGAVRQQGVQLAEVDILDAQTWIQSRQNGARAVKINHDTSMQVAAREARTRESALVTFGNGNAVREVVRTHYAPPGRLCPLAGQVHRGTQIHTILDIGSFVLTAGSQLANFGIMGSALHRLTTGATSPTVGLVTSETSISHCSEEFKDAHLVLHERCPSYIGLTDPSDSTSSIPDVLVTTSRSGKLLYDLLGGRVRSAKQEVDATSRLRGLFNRSKSPSMLPPNHMSSSVVIGGRGLVVHRAHLSSSADVLTTFQDALYLTRIKLVDAIRTDLEMAMQFTGRMTREQPRV
ncbi:MAG: hypothetical protein ACPGQS_07725 [Bradymonadia bacterium]